MAAVAGGPLPPLDHDECRTAAFAEAAAQTARSDILDELAAKLGQMGRMIKCKAYLTIRTLIMEK